MRTLILSLLLAPPLSASVIGDVQCRPDGLSADGSEWGVVACEAETDLGRFRVRVPGNEVRMRAAEDGSIRAADLPDIQAAVRDRLQAQYAERAALHNARELEREKRDRGAFRLTPEQVEAQGAAMTGTGR